MDYAGTVGLGAGRREGCFCRLVLNGIYMEQSGLYNEKLTHESTPQTGERFTCPKSSARLGVSKGCFRKLCCYFEFLNQP